MRFKLRMCWAILRGRQVAYRIRIEDGTIVLDGSRPGGFIVECTIIRTPTGIRIDDLPEDAELIIRD